MVRLDDAFDWLQRGKLDRLDRRAQLAVNLIIAAAAFVGIVSLVVLIFLWVTRAFT